VPFTETIDNFIENKGTKYILCYSLPRVEIFIREYYADNKHRERKKETMAIVIDSEKCTGCAACVDACPLELIELSGDVAVINDPDSCIDCGACVDECPAEAIAL
jgi:NAD-dependent dihydropyrimidine dehydrogenase PreA subunit